MAETTASSNIWNDRELGVDASTAQLLAEVSEADIEYVCNYKYPFLQLINANAVFYEELPLKFVTASTGWVIHDYGEAISIAVPHDSVQAGASNIVNQAKTVEEVAKLIVEKEWSEVELVEGTTMLKRLIWMEAKKFNFTLLGYTPSASDEKCYERLAKRAKDLGLSWEHASTAKIQQTGTATAE